MATDQGEGSAASPSVTPSVSTRDQWAVHAWLSCRCGGNYTLPAQPKIGDDLWCHFHQWMAKINRFTAIKQEVERV